MRASELVASNDAAHPLFHANQRQGIGGTSTSKGNGDKRQVPTHTSRSLPSIALPAHASEPPLAQGEISCDVDVEQRT
jgi:hypothetical protein